MSLNNERHAQMALKYLNRIEQEPGVDIHEQICVVKTIAAMLDNKLAAVLLENAIKNNFNLS